jgi:uncharacterized protein Yka (UPF0111/DUF47 family)
MKKDVEHHKIELDELEEEIDRIKPNQRLEVSEQSLKIRTW